MAAARETGTEDCAVPDGSVAPVLGEGAGKPVAGNVKLTHKNAAPHISSPATTWTTLCQGGGYAVPLIRPRFSFAA